MRAIVFFADSAKQGAPWYCRLLRPGFRHCGVAVRTEPETWIVTDPGSDICQQAVVCASLGQMVAMLRATFPTVVPLRFDPDAVRGKVAPPAPATCVEAVKMIIGVHNRWIITPYQLYKHIGGRL